MPDIFIPCSRNDQATARCTQGLQREGWGDFCKPVGSEDFECH